MDANMANAFIGLSHRKLRTFGGGGREVGGREGGEEEGGRNGTDGTYVTTGTDGTLKR
jgi:hypothetical protein